MGLMAERREPEMGWFEGREHHYPLRVFYEDTDYVDNRIMPIVGLFFLWNHYFFPSNQCNI